ncbi:hypothetical protein JVU11DRAFT_8894 [Chiua virens]|nr:hypothetical protein JVU11DRAFT_8894 [Chiua virens]
MAMFKQFGDPFHHEPRTAATTLAQLFCLNGVSELFWRNFPLSCPSFFIMPKLLHFIHKECWDHDIKWCLNIIGEAEVNFQFSVL